MALKTPTWATPSCSRPGAGATPARRPARRLNYARDVIGLAKVVAITKPTNKGSMAVLEKIGMKAAGMIRVPGYDEESAYYTT